MRIPRWVIPLPAIFLSFFSISAKAEPISGLNAVGYSVSAIPPIQSDTEYPTCGSELENNINRNFNGEPFQQCGDDLFMIHYTGYITIPENETIQFMVAGDDGATVKIGTEEFGTWNDKGCSWSAQTTSSFSAGSYALDGWFYEHGGGTCYILAWNIDNAGWEIVPDDAFTTTAVIQTTTTTITSTTTTSTTTTTTTQPPTSTTSSTTTLPQENSTTTEPIQTSTTTSTVDTTTTTTTTTSTTVPQTTTTTEAPYTPPQTSTTTSTTQPQAVTTTVAPDTSEVEDEPETETASSTTSPDDSLEEPVEPDETTIPETSFPETENATLPDESEQPTDTTEPQENTTDTTMLEEEPSSEETITEPSEESVDITIPESEPLLTDEEVAEVIEEVEVLSVINDELFKEILDVLESVTADQVVVVVEALLKADLSEEQVVSLASSSEVLENVNVEQAEQIFESLNEDALTSEQGAEIVEAVQSAPEAIRQTFEEKIDVFSGVFDSYVPVGSLIPVSARRTLVVVGAVLSMLPAPNLPKFR